MKPHYHASKSAKKFGGIPEDYIDIHRWFDQTKAHIADMRHRAVLHNAWGIFLCEQVFGELTVLPSGEIKKQTWVMNSDEHKVPVRSIAEQHVIDDMGQIVPLSECMKGLPMYNWFGTKITKSRIIVVD